ncbi:hypothetical protein AQUCO_01400795v1 [Aquilegia coerulea]|uniref:Myb-like domain-containing protein n=1 Tax=Aquilegia coerulea TaxID=218851 RepID=A0A2G5DYB3_AQUCA|nr:hypothetical protein AQUCO_01400795v1 [Aquilegia coerulea]
MSLISKWRKILPWEEHELKIFYEAYEQNGCKWNLLASLLPERNKKMLKMLYKQNEDYLTFPESKRRLIFFQEMVQYFQKNFVYVGDPGESVYVSEAEGCEVGSSDICSSDSKNLSSGDPEKIVSWDPVLHMGSRRLSIIPKWKKIARWDRVELAVFYTAYQLIGCDWVKIASFLPRRDVEMVKMLYLNNTVTTFSFFVFLFLMVIGWSTFLFYHINFVVLLLSQTYLKRSSYEGNLISFLVIVDMFQDKYVYGSDSGASEDSHNDDSEKAADVSEAEFVYKEADGTVQGKLEDAGNGLTKVGNSGLESGKVCLFDFEEGAVERKNVLVSVFLGDKVFWQKKFVSVSVKVCEFDSGTEVDRVKVGISACGMVFGDSDSHKVVNRE